MDTYTVTNQHISHCPGIYRGLAPSHGRVYGSFEVIVTYLQPITFIFVKIYFAGLP